MEKVNEENAHGRRKEECEIDVASQQEFKSAKIIETASNYEICEDTTDNGKQT